MNNREAWYEGRGFVMGIIVGAMIMLVSAFLVCDCKVEDTNTEDKIGCVDTACKKECGKE